MTRTLPTAHSPLSIGRSRCSDRRGIALVEAALVLTPLLMLALGLLDLGVGLFRFHVLSEATRQLARQASVHGQYASVLGHWGPASYSSTASATGSIAAAVRPYLVAIDSSTVSISVEWPDGSNQIEKAVRVTLSNQFRPLITSWFGGAVTLHAVSEMKIAH
jgi:Flp pilus assembly protein TadG